MTIRAVVFDIGGVLELVDDASWPHCWMASWERRLGLDTGAFATGLATHAPGGSVVTGEVSEAQMRLMYQDALGLDDVDTDELIREMWDAYCGELDIELFDYFVSLRSNYKTGILSNSGDGARREEQRRFGFQDVTDDIVYSHEVGLAKPDPKIYALTSDRLGVLPDEIVFLDDLPANVDAAREAGWHAVVHRDSNASITELGVILSAHP